jgi:predicted outer membrane repeat protein
MSGHAQNVGLYNTGPPETILVYSSIQQCVNVAGTNPACIRISTNTFFENVVVISNANITLEGGYDQTLFIRTNGYSVINGGGAGTTLWIRNSTCTVDRIAITGGAGELVNWWSGGGCLLHGSHVDFIDSPIYSNMAWNGGGLFVGLSSYAILDGTSAVYSNTASLNGGGIYVDGQLEILSDNSDVFDNTAMNNSGGGIAVNSGFLKLLYADVYGNTAATGTVASFGGGIAVMNGSLLEATNGTSIVDNHADFGGGIMAESSTIVFGNFDMMTGASVESNVAAVDGGGLYAGSASITYTRGLWSDNCAISNGGAIFTTNSTVDIYSSIITNNVAGESGGGIACKQGGTLCLHSCLVTANSLTNAYSYGGGVYVSDLDETVVVADHASFNPPDQWGALFQGNTAHAGAAIYMENTPTIITDTAIISNRSFHAPVSVSGSYYVPFGSKTNLIMKNSVIAENREGVSCGIVNVDLYSMAMLTACTIVSNSGYAVGVHSNCSLSVSNSILWNNYFKGAWSAAGSSVNIKYSDIEDGYPGTGNLDANPMLYKNYHLRAESPCIDTGSLDFPQYDIDGELRTNYCDMGVDEFIDSDSDSLPDIAETHTGQWRGETDTGTDPNDPDSDHDTMRDMDELYAGTNPNDPDSFLRILNMSFTNTTATIKWKGGTSVNQIVEYRDSPTGGIWTILQNIWAPTPKTNTFSDAGFPGRSRGIYRIHIKGHFYMHWFRVQDEAG